MFEVQQFGPGYRRVDTPAHCKEMYPALIHHDEALHVVELHFEAGGEMWEHDADHPILFIVIAGKGWMRVGGEEREVQAGQAVCWPTGVMHKVWTEQNTLTAIVVEERGHEQERLAP